MIEVSNGRVTAPLRSKMEIDQGNALGMMPGAMQDPAVHGMKLINLYPGNPAKGLSSHLGVMVLFDSPTGLPIAVLDAGALTSLRTAAATVLATKTLARKDSEVFGIIGAGDLARQHIDAFLACNCARKIRVFARRREAGRALSEKIGDNPNVELVENINDAISGCDVITTVTSSPVPVVKGKWLEPGQHINLVGASIRSHREIDGHGVTRLQYYVDARDSAENQAGEYLDELEQGRISQDFIRGEIGEILGGSVKGRSGSDQITAYKSLGVAAQDLAVSWAITQELGVTIGFLGRGPGRE